MGSSNSKKRLSNISNEEPPYMFLNNVIKLCKVTEIYQDGILQIAFNFNKRIMRWLIKLDNFHNIMVIDDLNISIIPIIDEIVKLLQKNKFLVYIKFGKFDNNYLNGTIYLSKSDIKNNRSVNDYALFMYNSYKDLRNINSKYNYTSNRKIISNFMGPPDLNFKPSLDSIIETEEPSLKMSISKKESSKESTKELKKESNHKSLYYELKNKLGLNESTTHL